MIKQPFLPFLKRIIFTLLNVLVVLAVFVGAIYLSKNRPASGTFVNKYATFDVVYASGKTEHFKNKNFGTVNRGDVVTVHLSLPETRLVKEPVLAFYIYHSVTEVWCNGELLDTYGEDIDASGRMVGNHRFLVSLPEESWGGEVTIILRVTENKAFNRIKNLRLYEAKDAYQFYIDADYIGFWVSMPLFLFGLVALFIMMLGGKFDSTARKGMYLSLFAVLAATWIMTSKGVQNLYGWTSFQWTQLEFVAVFTMATPVLLYACESEKHRVYRRVLAGMAILNCGFFAVATVLHLTNIAHYSTTLFASNILTVISGLLLVVFAIRRLVKGNRADKIFFSGMLILFFAGLFDLLRVNVFKYVPALSKLGLPSVLPIGVIFFLLYIIRSYTYDIMDKHRRLITAEVKSEELQHTLAAIPAGVCVLRLDEQFTLLQANDEFYRMIGSTREEALAAGYTNMIAVLQPEVRKQQMVRARQAVKEKKTAGEAELPIMTPRGQRLTVLVKYNRETEDSQIITANIVDITARKKAEEDLRVSEERYKLALNQSGKVFFFFDIPTRTMRLSAELAESFGLPLEVDNMPENFISQGLVEPERADNYRDFYRRIIRGEPQGSTVISCHMRTAPGKVLWYRITFISVFDDAGQPSSAIITYEDINKEYSAELSSRWKQLNLLSLPESQYVVAIYDLTRGRLLSQEGGLFAKLPEFLSSYEEINRFVLGHFVYEDDREAYNAFLERERLLKLFRDGRTEDSTEYRSLQYGSAYRWTSTTVQLIEDPYSSHVMGQFLFMDIHESKSGEMQLQHDMEAMKQELENSRIKVMINQMQPHFLYNALSAIQTIVKTDPNYAYQLLYDFTVHLRSSIKALSSDAPISFRDELKNITAYLHIEQMRFGDCLKVNYQIECEDFYVIPLSIQPLAENAARHGIYPKGEDGGVVLVHTYETPTHYMVEVSDDGVGFDVNRVLHEDNDSVGLKNLIFRLRSLMGAEVTINSVIGRGTTATVAIPKEGKTHEDNCG